MNFVTGQQWFISGELLPEDKTRSIYILKKSQWLLEVDILHSLSPLTNTCSSASLHGWFVTKYMDFISSLPLFMSWYPKAIVLFLNRIYILKCRLSTLDLSLTYNYFPLRFSTYYFHGKFSSRYFSLTFRHIQTKTIKNKSCEGSETDFVL